MQLTVPPGLPDNTRLFLLGPWCLVLAIVFALPTLDVGPNSSPPRASSTLATSARRDSTVGKCRESMCSTAEAGRRRLRLSGAGAGARTARSVHAVLT
jgi:hypothetical protein